MSDQTLVEKSERVTLTIKRPDGSLYWTEYFNSEADAIRWLETEMNRPYWGKAVDGVTPEVWDPDFKVETFGGYVIDETTPLWMKILSFGLIR